jgi:hypothetical protein
MDQWDWDLIDEWVVHESGNMTYREIALMSSELACFGHQPCSHEKVRERGKERMWWSRRAEEQAKKHGGIMQDYRQAYDIVTRTLIEQFKDLSASELASLGNLQLKYGEALMALNPPSKDSRDTPVYTRDDILRMAEEVEADHALRAIESPLELMAEETPSVDVARGADQGDNSVS